MKILTAFALLLFSSIIVAGNFPEHMLDKSEVSSNFIYHYNEIDKGYVQKLIRLSEGYLSFIEKNYFKPSFDYPISALVFSSKYEFQSYLKNKLGIYRPPNFGIYIKEYKLFATFRGSGIGTFTHEIMHPLVEANLPDRPVWAIEGIPSFFEKFIGYWQEDNLQLKLGYQNPWRVHQLGEGITELDLRSIIMQPQNSYKRFSNSELRMVSVFIDRQGLLKQYIQLVINKNKRGFNTYIEAAFDKPMVEIKPIWVAYLQDVKSNRNAIYKIPASTIVDSKSEYEDIINGLYLQKKL